MSLLEVNHLKKIYTARYGGNSVQALHVNFTIENGEYTAIMGESGSGKTTLLEHSWPLWTAPHPARYRASGGPGTLRTIPERQAGGVPPRKIWALYSRISTCWTPSPSGRQYPACRWCWTGWTCGKWTAV